MQKFFPVIVNFCRKGDEHLAGGKGPSLASVCAVPSDLPNMKPAFLFHAAVGKVRLRSALCFREQEKLSR
jgi:hypothetical protein